MTEGGPREASAPAAGAGAAANGATHGGAHAAAAAAANGAPAAPPEGWAALAPAPAKGDAAAAAKGAAAKGDAALEAAASGEAPELERALRKIGARVIPLTMAIALMNHLDRSNLAYAALSFNRDNNFDASIYSAGAALFFVSFAVFQVPANLVMVRVGFRAWLAFLLVGWGIVAASFMFINSVWSFYLLRLLLGVFEAGAFPAMWFALAVFFPRKRITKPYAYLTIGIMVANMVGAPIAAGLLAMDGLGGLKGWQWLFLLEGIPSVLLGGLVFLLLPGSIAEATFLTPEERDALSAAVSCDHVPGPLASDMKGAATLLKLAGTNGYLWLSSLCGMLTSIASHTYLAYTPIIIANLLAGTALSNNSSVAAAKGSKSLLPVALSMVPYTLAAVGSYAVAHVAQRRDEQFWFVSSCLLAAGVILAVFPPLAKASIAAGFLSLSVSLAAGAAANGPAMALVSRLCKGREQVVALPMFSSFSVLGGIVGPLLTGALMSRLGGFTWVTIIMGVLMFSTGLLVLVLRVWVMHDGGLPDGGLGKRYAAGRVRSEVTRSVFPAGVPGAADDVCVLLDKPPPGSVTASTAARRSGAAPKADA